MIPFPERPCLLPETDSYNSCPDAVYFKARTEAPCSKLWGMPACAGEPHADRCSRCMFKERPFAQSDLASLPFRSLSGVDTAGEYYGKDHHAYELYLALNDIEHQTTRINSPHTNGFVERFNRTVPDEFLRPSLQKKFYGPRLALRENIRISLHPC